MSIPTPAELSAIISAGLSAQVGKIADKISGTLSREWVPGSSLIVHVEGRIAPQVAYELQNMFSRRGWSLEFIDNSSCKGTRTNIYVSIHVSEA